MKIDPSSIAFDIDDVFADTMALFLEIARNDHNLAGLKHEDITSYMVEECIDIDAAVLEDIFSKILNGSHSSSLKPVMDQSSEKISPSVVVLTSEQTP